MTDWIRVFSAIVLAALIGFGFVLWERYEDRRLVRERLRRPLPGRHRRRLGSIETHHRRAA
jgi:hypothetical protein